MIDETQFFHAWRHICSRFNRTFEQEQALAYFEFLAEQMDTDGFLAAARSVWATAKFFPRPADFLVAGASGDWSVILRCMDLSHRKEAWHGEWSTLSERSRAACLSLGGIPTMYELHGKDSIRLKNEWERAFEQAVGAAVVALPAPKLKALKGAA